MIKANVGIFLPLAKLDLQCRVANAAPSSITTEPSCFAAYRSDVCHPTLFAGGTGALFLLVEESFVNPSKLDNRSGLLLPTPLT